MNFEDYKKIKDIAKRYSFLKELAIRHPEKTSKEFFLAVFKKERYLDMRLTAIRGYAVFATEKEIEPLMKKMTELLRKRPQTTPYNYQEYEILRSAYLMPYLLEKYGYTCFKDFNQQLNLQYDDMLTYSKVFSLAMKTGMSSNYFLNKNLKKDGKPYMMRSFQNPSKQLTSSRKQLNAVSHQPIIDEYERTKINT